ncbi:MAG: class II aldolase/adducin family protein [Gammaproteobacteria bacterium]|nr:class II aldolase/adducin family protein [Gammaproteobacteria bacterium]
MSETEGTIKFAYELSAPTEPVADDELMRPLFAWRTLFRRLDILGQHPERYGGFGFGNLSARDPDRLSEFIISASQTSGLDVFDDEHMVRVTHCNLDRFRAEALGNYPPSSETITHAMVYSADPRVKWVFHCHSPEIWNRVQDLALPCTTPEVDYGSPAMVDAVARLLETHHSRPIVFATLGHVDGVFACGPTASDTGGLLVSYLAKAIG